MTVRMVLRYRIESMIFLSLSEGVSRRGYIQTPAKSI